MIRVRKSSTADTRTCDWAKVTKEELRDSSLSHIADVQAAMAYFQKLITSAAMFHDSDKIGDIDGFHDDFRTGFETREWFKRHLAITRHHLGNPDGVPHNVTLIDVLEMVADCVTAGMARSGSVYDLELPDELLRTALKNTVDMLIKEVEVID
jgi:hypothetical protein